jgi:sarcosine oxidase
MPGAYDAIVVGLGGMGSSAAYHLARRGQRVFGLERFGLAHANGSSHGGSRIIRQAYFEDPAYVPLVLRAYELWDEIERASGEEILTITGGLMMGPEDSRTVAGSIESAREWDLSYEILEAKEIRSRFPAFTPEQGMVGLFEAKAGLVRPERSVAAHARAAEQRGAVLRFDEPVISWEADPSGEGVRVRTERDVYEAGRLVVCAGPWASGLLGGLDLGLWVQRLVQFWFSRSGSGRPRTACSSTASQTTTLPMTA